MTEQKLTLRSSLHYLYTLCTLSLQRSVYTPFTLALFIRGINPFQCQTHVSRETNRMFARVEGLCFPALTVSDIEQNIRQFAGFGAFQRKKKIQCSDEGRVMAT